LPVTLTTTSLQLLFPPQLEVIVEFTNMRNIKYQAGFLLIGALFLIIIIGVFSAAIAHWYTVNTMASTKFLQSKQALYIAEAGMERGMYELAANNAACSDIETMFPNQTDFGGGQFQLSTEHYQPSSMATLASNISDSESIVSIPLSSTAGYASRGRVQIGSELIDYTRIENNELVGISRGRGGTQTVAHNAGDKVYQNLCVLTSQGGIPTISTPAGTHTVKRDLFKGIHAIERAAGQSGRIYHYNGQSWSLEADVGSYDIFWLTCINSNNCWAVGIGGKIYHYNGSAWSQYQDVGSTNLYGGTCTSANNCWAVGSSGKIYHYTGNYWNYYQDVGSEHLTEVVCTAENSCWASGFNGKIYRFTGGSWYQYADLGSNDIYGLSCPASNDCWATGDNGEIYHYNGHWWSKAADMGYNMIIEVACTSSNNCWAVGASGKIYHYNGSSWSQFTDVGSYTLRYVICLEPNDCLAVGDAGRIYRFNGSTWSLSQDVGYTRLETVATRSIGDNKSIAQWHVALSS
jgi:type II secretory pathway pseudopilin PulG